MRGVRIQGKDIQRVLQVRPFQRGDQCRGAHHDAEMRRIYNEYAAVLPACGKKRKKGGNMMIKGWKNGEFHLMDTDDKACLEAFAEAMDRTEYVPADTISAEQGKWHLIGEEKNK